MRFYFNHPVDRIEIEGKKVKGVVSNGNKFPADIVVSNADVYFTYQHLLKIPRQASKVLKQERSCSGVIFYWGMKQHFPELHLHNIFFSAAYKEEFEHVFRHKTLFDDPTVYINITSKMDASHAPEGKENWFVMVNVPANKGQDWDTIITKTRKNVLAKLSRELGTDIEPLIEEEDLLDPRSIDSKTSSYQGSLYGTSSNNKFAAFLRHKNFSSQFGNLFFCGGSVHPGGGIPLCLLSGKIVSDLIAQKFKP